MYSAHRRASGKQLAHNLEKSDNSRERILLVEDNKIVSDEGQLATIFNINFNSITDNLEIPA